MKKTTPRRLQIQFEITLKWIENRATYHNLKVKDSLNALPKENFEKLWLPQVIYENTDQKKSTRLGVAWEWKTTVVAQRQGNFTRSGLDTLDEIEIFKGSENRLVMSQVYTHTFQCGFKLATYPFDTQVNLSLSHNLCNFAQTCSIDMAMGTLDATTVRLISDQHIMSQALDMPIFRIADWKFQNKKFDQEKNGISMVVVMKRKITSEMMTTYFPSLLLTAITFATTFFKPFFFEAALSVNLTTMLVMTTIFISKMESLPHTSDIKMIDIWLVLCQMVPFAEVILLTGMEYQRTDDSNWKEGNAEGSLFLKSGPCIWALTVWEGTEGVKTLAWKVFCNILPV